HDTARHGAARARAIVDDDAVTPVLRHLLRDHAADDVDLAPGRVAHEHAHVARRELMRLRGGLPAEERQGREYREACPFHDDSSRCLQPLPRPYGTRITTLPKCFPLARCS